MNFFKRIGFKYAIAGIRAAFKSEFNFRLHVWSMIIVILAGYYFKLTATEWCILFLCIGGVFVSETFNTALEQLVNLVQPDHHPVAGRVKDLASGAVMLACVVAVICGGIIFGPRIYTLFLN